MRKRNQVKVSANMGQSKRHEIYWTANITTGKVSRKMGTVREIVRQEEYHQEGKYPQDDRSASYAVQDGDSTNVVT